MDVRFYIDPDTGDPHIYEQGVTEEEVEDVLRGPGEDFPAARNSRMKIGQTSAGRYLQVIYVPDEGFDSVFVVTPTNCLKKQRKPFAGGNGENQDENLEVPPRMG